MAVPNALCGLLQTFCRVVGVDIDVPVYRGALLRTPEAHEAIGQIDDDVRPYKQNFKST